MSFCLLKIKVKDQLMLGAGKGEGAREGGPKVTLAFKRLLSENRRREQ